MTYDDLIQKSKNKLLSIDDSNISSCIAELFQDCDPYSYWHHIGDLQSNRILLATCYQLCSINLPPIGIILWIASAVEKIGAWSFSILSEFQQNNILMQAIKFTEQKTDV